MLLPQPPSLLQQEVETGLGWRRDTGPRGWSERQWGEGTEHANMLRDVTGLWPSGSGTWGCPAQNGLGSAVGPASEARPGVKVSILWSRFYQSITGPH